jgi:hypothetical protein
MAPGQKLAAEGQLSSHDMDSEHARAPEGVQVLDHTQLGLSSATAVHTVHSVPAQRPGHEV